MNTFGHTFRINLFGESHGPVVGVVIDGVPPGLPLSAEDFASDLGRRRGTDSPGSTPRHEDDRPRIISGIYKGFTTGIPLTVVFDNTNTRPGDYAAFRRHPRPSHADRVAEIKYRGFNDPAGGGMFSGRMTVAIVAAGVVAKKILRGITFETAVTEIGGVADPARFDELLAGLRHKGDTAGGVVEVRVCGVPAGLGEPFFDSVESVASHMLFSIPGIKGVEFGSGFASARRKGSENNDRIIAGDGRTLTNNDGGVNGGITNGNEIVARVAFRPAPSIAVSQDTYDFAAGRLAPLAVGGRHDTCIALRGAVVAEAALAVTLADLLLRERGSARSKR